MRLLPISGSSEPTGEPLPVADEAERLTLTPVSKMRVEQLDDGSLWTYDVGYGDWVPCPPLVIDTPLSSVVSGVPVQTFSHPSGSDTGTLVIPTTDIQPYQAYCSYIKLFGPSNVVALTINDEDCIFIEGNMVGSYARMQILMNGDIDIDISATLDSSNVGLILAGIYNETIGLTLSGTVTLLGFCAAPTKTNRVAVGTCGAFATAFEVWEDGIYNGQLQYGGTDPATSHLITLRWDTTNTRWEFIDQNTATMVAYSNALTAGQAPSEATDYYDYMGFAQGTIVTALAAKDVNQYALEQGGLTVYTN